MSDNPTTTGFPYTLTRELDAPAVKVWQAWTIAENYSQWAGATSVSLDVRPGGAWSAVMVIPGGGEFPLSGTYVEVVDNKRLVMGMDVPGRTEPTLMTMDLDARGEQTQITLTQTLDTAEERDQTEQGSNMLLDALTSYLAKP